MSENWRDGFRRALIDTLIKNGVPSTESSHYWHPAPNFQEIRDAATCGPVDYDYTSWKDGVTWSGADTFNDGNEKQIITLTVVMTNGDGPYTFRYEGNASDLIVDMMREMGESR